ncbi:MAG TPA: sulfotransferase domain-containing protein [Pseudomonadales bacterium]|nr:sulfotransferase domain-containing protein [Pseudomonadales bacterium]
MAGSPQTQRIYQNHTIDSTRWEAFAPRAGDVIVTTSYKSGTTWTLGLLYRMLRQTHGVAPPPMDYWLDARMFPVPLEAQLAELEAMTHPRILKSHLAADGLPLWPDVKYVVVGRDPRDVFMSLVNHYEQFTDRAYAAFNESPGRVGDPIPRYDGDVHALWRGWITRGWFDWESEGFPWWGNMHHVATWWPLRHADNVLFVHYNDLQTDLDAQIRRLAEFVGRPMDDAAVAAVREGSSIESMRNDVIAAGDPLSMMFRDGAKGFFFKGTNRRWEGVLTEEELALYPQTRDRVLSPDCATWLETGGTIPV